jgi:hypothetical protein
MSMNTRRNVSCEGMPFGSSSLNKLTPADVYFGRSEVILRQRERIKRQTIRQYRLLHHSQAA